MINVAPEGRAIARALKGMLKKAKEAGVKNPKIFFEAEAMTVYVVDGDHPGDTKEGATSSERQAAVVGQAVIGSFGAGAW